MIRRNHQSNYMQQTIAIYKQGKYISALDVQMAEAHISLKIHTLKIKAASDSFRKNMLLAQLQF